MSPLCFAPSHPSHIPTTHLRPPTPRQRPRHTHNNLALAEGPEINGHADHVVESGIGGLIEQEAGEAGERVEHQPRLDAAVHAGQETVHA